MLGYYSLHFPQILAFSLLAFWKLVQQELQPLDTLFENLAFLQCVRSAVWFVLCSMVELLDEKDTYLILKSNIFVAFLNSAFLLYSLAHSLVQMLLDLSLSLMPLFFSPSSWKQFPYVTRLIVPPIVKLLRISWISSLLCRSSPSSSSVYRRLSWFVTYVISLIS